MGTTIDLNHVAWFVRIVEAESFTRAAEGLGLRKSSLRRAVSRLEEDLGVRLLQRTTRRLSLTDAGRAYFAQAQSSLSGLAEAAATVSNMGTEPRGVVRVTTPVDIGVTLFTDVVARFFPGQAPARDRAARLGAARRHAIGAPPTHARGLVSRFLDRGVGGSRRARCACPGGCSQATSTLG